MAEILHHLACKHNLEIKGVIGGRATTLVYDTWLAGFQP